MLEIYIRHCNIYTDAETLLTALDSVHFGTKLVTARRAREAAEAAASYAQQQLVIEEPIIVSESPSGNSKRKRDDAADEVAANFNKKMKGAEQESNATTTQEQQLKRDRENTSVFVTNLPAAVTQTKVRQYFKEYGHINKLELKDEADKLSATALIEFRSHEDVQSALIRDGKYFGEKQISVEAASGCTLYVTNFPPEADDQYICDLFKDYAEVFAIRWPSLKYNAHRRFCYVTFRSQTHAAAASTNVHQKILPGGFKVIAQYSDPPAKKSREGATAEGREVHITGIDTTLTEDDLQKSLCKVWRG